MQRDFAEVLMNAIVKSDEYMTMQANLYDDVRVCDRKIVRMLGYGIEIVKYDSYDTFRVIEWSGNGLTLKSNLYALYYFDGQTLTDTNGNAIDYKA